MSQAPTPSAPHDVCKHQMPQAYWYNAGFHWHRYDERDRVWNADRMWLKNHGRDEKTGEKFFTANRDHADWREIYASLEGYLGLAVASAEQCDHFLAWCAQHKRSSTVLGNKSRGEELE